ncbi:MAG: F0F1 ATP synthase subunit epsilon [Pseudomonadota bacterium]
MKSYVMHLQSATQYERIDDVTGFVGEDASGSFGLRAHHARFMTALSYGMARYRRRDGVWRYLAFPGGLLYFVDNVLFVSCRRFLHDDDYARINTALFEQLLKEEESLRKMRECLARLEQEMLRHMWDMGREQGGI